MFDGLEVKQFGSGADKVSVTIGAAAIKGTDEIDQGMYFVDVIDDEESNSITAPGEGQRIDSVVLRVNDSTAGGAVGDNAVVELVEGTVLPGSSILLATIKRTSGTPILTADITDARPLGPFPYGIGSGGPPAVGVEGDLYIQVS